MDVTRLRGFLALVSVVAAAAGSDSLRWSAWPQGSCQDGWTQNCCWGWTRNIQGQCRPVCELGCKHGQCVGPDQCLCRPGYTGKTCNQDVNECAYRPCKYRCVNTPGSYKCYCLNGFMMANDGSCRNARTCALANCQYSCGVMKGVVRCQCPSPGLRLASDGRTCVDVDECVTGRAKCPSFRECVNTFGSFICRCHRGFYLQHINGKHYCADKMSSVCGDKPGHKRCRCSPHQSGKGYTCTSIHQASIQPARPASLTTTTVPTTTVPTTTVPITTVPITTVLTTTAPITTVPTTTALTTTVPITTVPTTTVLITTVPTTTLPIATVPTTTFPTTTLPITTVPITTVFTTTVPITTVPTTSVPITTVSTVTVPTTSVPSTTLSSTTVPLTTVPTTTVPTTTATLMTSLTTTEMLPTTALTTLPTAGRTTTLDNRVHRTGAARPRGDVHIPRFENNFFDWDFDVELGNTADFSRDDPGSGGVRCSFDEGLCNWMTDTEGDLNWEFRQDPAGGRYLTVPESPGRRSVRGARLTVPLAPPTKRRKGSDLCLEFRHRLQGHHIGSLQLFLRKGRGHSPSIWSRTGGGGWRHAHVTLPASGVADIVLKGERRRGRRGDVSVDDVSLSRGACREPALGTA